MSQLTMSLLAKVLDLLAELNEKRQHVHDLTCENYDLQRKLKSEIRKNADMMARAKLQLRS